MLLWLLLFLLLFQLLLLCIDVVVVMVVVVLQVTDYTRYYVASMSYLKELSWQFDPGSMRSYVLGPKNGRYDYKIFPMPLPGGATTSTACGKQQQQQQLQEQQRHISRNTTTK